MFTRGLKSLFNKLSLIKAYKNRNAETLNYPPVLNIETSSRCNLRCSMCSREARRFTRKTGDMDKDLFEKVIDEVHEYSELAVLHNDGEPLMNKCLPEMVAYGRQHHLKTMVSTNATLLDKDLSSALIEAGLDIMIFAVDGATKETYERIRAGAGYERVTGNIHGFIEKKKKLQKKNPFVVLQFIEMEQNRHEIPEFRQYWSGYPVRVFIKPSTEYQRKTNASKDFHCDRLWYQSVIWNDGNVVPCCMDINGDYSLGNIKDDSFFNIWNGEQMKDIREKDSHNKFELCKNCNYVLPRKHSVLTDLGLSVFHLGTLAKVLYEIGYAKKSQL